MEKENSNLDIKHHEILYVILALFLFLLIYFIYVSSNINISTEKTQTNLEYSENIENNTQIEECSNLEGELKTSCLIKISICKTDDCYYNQARLIQNESDCFNIVDENLRVGCSASIGYDSIVQGAVLNNNLSLCENLESAGAIACRNNYYYAKAVNTGNKTYCSELSVEDLKNECLSN